MARIIKPEQAAHLEGHCGNVIRLLAGGQNPANFDVVKITTAQEHMHKISTEYYYVLKGEGRLVLGARMYLIKAGYLIEIRPNTWHKAIAEQTGLELLVVGVPPLMPEDTYFKTK